MRLDAKRERELARRRGLALRTILSLIWLALCFVAAYFLVNYLFQQEVLSWRFFRIQLLIPYSVSERIILVALTIVLVVAINFVVLVIYGLFSSTGRRRPGTPSMHSADPDLDDHKYDYR